MQKRNNAKSNAKKINAKKPMQKKKTILFILFLFYLLFFIYFHLTGKALMTSVPPDLSSLGEIRDWVRTAMEASETWQKMRVIVIGHGRIGKTSLIHTLQDSLVCKNEYQVLLCLFPC